MPKELEFVDQGREQRITVLKQEKRRYLAVIPGYTEMVDPEKSDYEYLYLLACCPRELLANGLHNGIDGSLLPDDLPNLHALIYFVLHYNLTYIWHKGRHEAILPFIPSRWTQAEGLSMGFDDGRYAPLLDELAPLSPSKSLYFSVLMLSLVLIRRPDATEENYNLLILLLTSVLDGLYDQAMLKTITAQSAKLKTPWLPQYLPAPPIVTDTVDPEALQTIKTTLLGGAGGRGMFLPYREVPAPEPTPNVFRCIIL
ncbi:MAG: hypothetical protein KBD83_00705 [Gammaproteobacteria bacterium]|nr:hypothetical protein [Gammaproteobacteria bacterium]